VSEPGQPSRATRSLLAGVLLAALGGGLLAHLYVASWLATDYYDATDYLINARFLAGHGTWLEGVRPPLPSLLQIGFFLGGEPTAWRGPHLLSTLVSYAALLACYALFAQSSSRLRALAATLLFAGSRLFVHYAPFVMADLLGTGLVAAVLTLHLRARAGGSAVAWLGAAVLGCLAIASRHPLAILGPFLLGYEIFESLRGRRATRALVHPAFWAAVLVPIPLFVAAMVALFHARLGWDTSHALHALAQVFTSQAEKSGISTRVAESQLEYFDSLRVAFRWPMCILMFAGTLWAALAGRDDDRLHCLWLVVNVALYSLVITRRESRYLLPAVPSAVFLAVRALGRLESRLTPRRLAGGWRPRGVAALRAALWVGVAAPLVPGVVTEARAFLDPVYRIPFQQRVADAAGALVRPPGRLLVAGDKYAVHPVAYWFTEGDEYYYFHHIAPRTFHYWLGLDPVTVAAAVPEGRWLEFPSLLDWAAPGDVIATLEPETYQTRILPARKLPLRLARVWAERAALDSEAPCDVYRSSHAALSVCGSGADRRATLDAAWPVEVYVPSADRFVSRGWIEPRHTGASPRPEEILRWDGPSAPAVILAGYDAAIAFCPPGPSGVVEYRMDDRTWPGPGACPNLWKR